MRASFRQGDPAATPPPTPFAWGFSRTRAVPAGARPGARRRARPPDRVRRGEGRFQEARDRCTQTRGRSPRAWSRSVSASATSSIPSARGSPAPSALRAGGAVGALRSRWAVPEGVEQDPIARGARPRARCSPHTASTGTRARDDHDDKGVERSRSSPARTSGRRSRRPAIVAEHQNTARDLQNLPANDLTPSTLAEHALARVARDRWARGRGARPRPDRGARDGRPAGGREGLARGAAPDRAALRRRRRRRSGSSARPSPSTPAASRSSPRERCRR